MLSLDPEALPSSFNENGRQEVSHRMHSQQRPNVSVSGDPSRCKRRLSRTNNDLLGPPRVFALDMECYHGHLKAASYASIGTVSHHFVATTSGGFESVSLLYSNRGQVDEPRKGFCNGRLSGSNQRANSNYNSARHALYCIA